MAIGLCLTVTVLLKVLPTEWPAVSLLDVVTAARFAHGIRPWLGKDGILTEMPRDRSLW